MIQKSYTLLAPIITTLQSRDIQIHLVRLDKWKPLARLAMINTMKNLGQLPRKTGLLTTVHFFPLGQRG